MHDSFQFQNFYNELNNIVPPVPAPTVPSLMVSNPKPPVVEAHKPNVTKMDNWATDFMNEAGGINFVNDFNQMQSTPQPQLQPFNAPCMHKILIILIIIYNCFNNKN